ncbi:MAG TPA: N-acyl homoserine lactonase family protein [Solirubrobacterales bacterium]
MKVEMLNAGWFTSAAGIWRRDDDFDRQVRFPVPAYVIETAEERILVDTGLHPAAAKDATRHYGEIDALKLFQLELDASIDEQIDLTTITKVVMTHLHFDHAGGLALLPSSVPIVVQRREWEAGHDAASIAKNFYFPVDYGAIAEQIMLIDGDHDLLGDGSIQLLSTPGHTPGHQSVRVGERLVIGGDVTHFASGLDDRRFPVFADDFDAQAASADRLCALRDAGAVIRPGHDPDALAPGPIQMESG